MKLESKEEQYLHERLEALSGPVPDTCKKQIREAKRKVKRQIAKSRRNSDKIAVRKLSEIADD